MRVAFLLNDAGLYGANLSLSNMIKSYGFKDCLVLSPSEGPFLSLLKETGCFVSWTYFCVDLRTGTSEI